VSCNQAALRCTVRPAPGVGGRCIVLGLRRRTIGGPLPLELASWRSNSAYNFPQSPLETSLRASPERSRRLGISGMSHHSAARPLCPGLTGDATPSNELDRAVEDMSTPSALAKMRSL